MLSLDPGFASAAMLATAAEQACPQRWLALVSSVISKAREVILDTTANIRLLNLGATRKEKHRSRGSRKFRRVIIIVGIGASLAFLAQIIAGAKLGVWLRIGITGFGMLCTGLAVVLPLIQQRTDEQALLNAEEAANEGRLGAHTRLQDCLIPGVSSVIGAIANEQSADRRRELKSNLKRAIVDLAAREIGPSRTRACYFDHELGPPRLLTCREYWAGRSTRPTRYTEETELGRAALTMVSRRRSSFRSDLDNDAPDGWPSDKEYKTYIAVTVAAGSRIFGMFTVDSLKAGDLVASDVAQMEMFASFLAAGLSVGEELM